MTIYSATNGGFFYSVLQLVVFGPNVQPITFISEKQERVSYFLALCIMTMSVMSAFEAFPKSVDIFCKMWDASEDLDYNFMQCSLFQSLAEDSQNPELQVVYLVAAIECNQRISKDNVDLATIYFKMAKTLGSEFFHNKSIGKARKGLAELTDLGSDSDFHIEKAEMKKILTCGFKTCFGVDEKAIKVLEENVYSLSLEIKDCWMSLKPEIKRKMMQVSVSEFEKYVKVAYGKQGPKETHKKAVKEIQQALDHVLSYVRRYKQWKLWFCRTCSIRFSSFQDCNDHLEIKHASNFKPSSVKRIKDVWADMISVGGWEPVDAVAATEMIKNQLSKVKDFAYENGWSKDWPSAVDEERGKLLKEVHLLLVSFCVRKILPCSIRDWLMDIVVNQLEKLEVSKDVLTDCGLVETPQGICFLGCHDLNQILASLRTIKLEVNDGTDMVCRGYRFLSNSSGYKEKIDLDRDFSVLLLDKRLLNSKVNRIDNEGTIRHFDPNVHYSKVHVSGDDFLSWLSDYDTVHESFQFPRPVQEHNVAIWVAVLRAVQLKCRNLETKYRKKLQLHDYEKALTDFRGLCMSMKAKERNWKSFASLLRDISGEEDTAEAFLCAARDVLVQSSYPNLDVEGSFSVTRKCKHPTNKLVLKSIEHLKSAVKKKIFIVDLKILLIESERINLLNDLTRLAEFDYRYYIHVPLRKFMLNRLRREFNESRTV